MDISSFIKNPVPNTLSSTLSSDNANTKGSSQHTPVDVVSLSERGRGYTSGYQQSSAAGYEVIPVNQRPTSEQSADTILGFIGNYIKNLAANGADDERLEQAFNAASKGFEQGLGEAKNILEGLSVLDGDIAAGVDLTEQLVMEGLAALKQEYFPSAEYTATESEPAVSKSSVRSKVVTAYQQQSFEQYSYSESRSGDAAANGIRTQAVTYAESYRSSGAVSLSLRTQDGDIIQLSFNAATSASESAALVDGSFSYLSETSTSSQFSFSINGELDAGEREALNQLLADVSALSDEFFNGDFNKAVDLAMAFEMDASEFSTMALDLSRSTSVSMLESVVTTTEGSIVPDFEQIMNAHTDGLKAMVEKLLQMMEQAKTFDEPQQLLADLLSNQVAQLSSLAV